MRKIVLSAALVLIVAFAAIAAITPVYRGPAVGVISGVAPEPQQGGNAISYVNRETGEIAMALIANGDAVKDFATVTYISPDVFQVTTDNYPRYGRRLNARVTLDIPRENAVISGNAPLLAKVSVWKKDARGNFNIRVGFRDWDVVAPFPGTSVIGVEVQYSPTGVVVAGNALKIRVDLRVSSNPSVEKASLTNLRAGDAFAAFKVKVTTDFFVTSFVI